MEKTTTALLDALGVALLVAILSVAAAVVGWALSELGPIGVYSSEMNHSRWSSVQGTILFYSGPDLWGYVSVSFEYTVAGKTYTGTQQWRTEEDYYSKGERVVVFYDPSKPSAAVLEASRPSIPLETLVFWLLLSFILGLGAFVAHVAVAIWAWGTAFISRRLEGSAETAVWSWRTNTTRAFRVFAIAFGLALSRPISLAISPQFVFWVMAGVYLGTPIVLLFLLKAWKGFPRWLASLGLDLTQSATE